MKPYVERRSLDVQQRNNIQVIGSGPTILVFAHGFGCDQNMWQLFVPYFEDRYTCVLFDLVGGGQSDLAAYDFDKYSSLAGYADDVLEVVDHVAGKDKPVVFIGHSVSAMIGMLAAIASPERFAACIMLAPSPSFVNDGDYIGGFERADIDELIDTLEKNFLGWSSSMAPAIIGVPDQPKVRADFSSGFCRTDPKIAQHFAKVTFLADHRRDLAKVKTPTLLIQASDDMLAPPVVGEFMRDAIRGSRLVVVDNVGHCPHITAVHSSQEASTQFLTSLGL